MTVRSDAELAARHLGRSNDRVGVRHRQWERELAIQYQQEPSSRHTVIEALKPMAYGVARRYHRGEEPLEDLEQVAMVGLIKALRGFDPGRGTPFASFALPTITGEVRRHYRDTGWSVHVARNGQELAQKVSAAERAAGHSLTAEECSKALGISVEDVVTGQLARQAMRADSLDRPRPGGAEDDEPAYNPASVEPGYETAEIRATLGHLTEGLPERERTILTLRYARDLSQAEIGQRVGLSQMHVSRILRRTLAQLNAAA